MTQAKRVRSTPRTSASKIKINLTANGQDRDRHHAEAFRGLETPIRELWCMAEIAEDVAAAPMTNEQIEVIHFTIYRLNEMIRDLRAKYQADLNAAKVQA